MLPLFDGFARDEPLAGLEVLVLDCQATAASPRGHLLELGWARARTADVHPETRLIRLPRGARIPPSVTRVTGLSQQALTGAVPAAAAWRGLLEDASRLAAQPAPAVAHFAQFERPFLQSLAGGMPPLDLLCTHEIARRLLPDLPRCTLRALTGYFGRGVGVLRRSTQHVEATAFVWRELVGMLDAAGISTWTALHEWLAAPRERRRMRRVWPMPRELRLRLPDAPGVYRFLRTNGDVLYVGKAASLHNRVNSYFRKQHGTPERLLEMLSQARDVAFDVTPTALEAALLESDEIKRHTPPYNRALVEDRRLWFATPDFRERRPAPSHRCRVGPFASAHMLEDIAGLAADDPAAPHRILCLGRRLWRDGAREAESELDADVQMAIDELALRLVLSRRRARWLTRLLDASLTWSERGPSGTRLMEIHNGEIVRCEAVEPGTTLPVPPGHRRSAAERREAFTVARFDRLRVLTTELKRLVAEGAPVSLRFGPAPALTVAELARVLARF